VCVCVCVYRKYIGGIKLSLEQSETAVQEELNLSTVSDDFTTESSKEVESDKQQKEKADALWADFLNDVGCIPKKSQSYNAVSVVIIIKSIITDFGLSVYDASFVVLFRFGVMQGLHTGCTTVCIAVSSVCCMCGYFCLLFPSPSPVYC